MIAHLVEFPSTSQHSSAQAGKSLRRVLEGIGAAVGGIDALERQVSAPLTWRLAIALDLAALAFVAASGYVSMRMRYLVGCICQ